jgi:hypothetical protein
MTIMERESGYGGVMRERERTVDYGVCASFEGG